MRVARVVYPLLVSVYIMLATVFITLVASLAFTSATANAPVINNGTITVSNPTYSDKSLTEIATIINSERTSRGLPPLQQSPELDKVAASRATDMQTYGYYAHQGHDGRFFYDVMQEQGMGYTFSCENLNTTNKPDSKKYVESWLDSPAHHDCLLKDSHRYAGYAVVELTKLNGISTKQQVVVAIYSDRVE